MNERIQKLSNQAYDELVNQTGNIVVFDEDFQQRFAQLIVRECAGIVEDAVDHREPASTYVGKILKHFGVEE